MILSPSRSCHEDGSGLDLPIFWMSPAKKRPCNASDVGFGADIVQTSRRCCGARKRSQLAYTMLRWKQDALHRALCGSTLSNVREENGLDLRGEQGNMEDEDCDSDSHEVARCLSPERVQSPTDSSMDSSWSPQPSSPVDSDWGLPEEIPSWFKVFPESKPDSSISLVDLNEDGDDHALPEIDPASNDRLPLFGSGFTPWMYVFDLDAACGSAQSDDGESDEPVPLPKQPLHPRPRDSSSWFGDVQEGLGIPSAMNQIFACLDPEYGRVMTIHEETTMHNSHFPSSPTPDRRLLPRPIPTNPSTGAMLNPLPCQYFSNFATEHNIEAIYIPVCLLFLGSFCFRNHSIPINH